jgi:hypothetical protein
MIALQHLRGHPFSIGVPGLRPPGEKVIMGKLPHGLTILSEVSERKFETE